MKPYFVCSLCRHGVHGGLMYVDKQVIKFKTGKVTIKEQY